MDLLASIAESVVAVSNEGSLVETAGRIPVRLAVIDLSLGSGDAVGMLRRVRLRYPDLGVIVLSDDDSAGLRNTILDAGADCVIFAPAAAVELQSAARTLLLEPDRLEPHDA